MENKFNYSATYYTVADSHSETRYDFGVGTHRAEEYASLLPWNERRRFIEEGGFLIASLNGVVSNFWWGDTILLIRVPEGTPVKKEREGLFRVPLFQVERIYHKEKNFSEWFNPEEVEYTPTQWCVLIQDYRCVAMEQFWNAEKFPWELLKNKKFLKMLITHRGSELETWWDPTRFDWEGGSPRLADECGGTFHIWWDPEKFNWRVGSKILASELPDLFEEWWDPARFHFESGLKYLDLYCSEYRKIWEQSIPEHLKS